VLNSKLFFICLLLVKPLILLLPTPPLLSKTGLRLLALARFSGSELDESSSIGGGDVYCLLLRVDERVTGPKYPSFWLPTSDGVGLGDMTRGVLGIWYWRDDSMAERQQVGK
jgi:hypothetical protein